jgi:adenylate kinase family enzyme
MAVRHPMTGGDAPIPLRIIITGTSGAGKTTLARELAARLDLPHVELDAINWQPDWRDLKTDDPLEFVRRVSFAVEPDCWIADGAYHVVRDLLWRRATHLVWLDYERSVIMRRVILRSIHRAVTGRELWPGTGNRENVLNWLRPSHPIRWAWHTWAHWRRYTGAVLADPAYAHLNVLHLRQPRDARSTVEALAEARWHGTIQPPGHSPGGGAP